MDFFTALKILELKGYTVTEKEKQVNRHGNMVSVTYFEVSKGNVTRSLNKQELEELAKYA